MCRAYLNASQTNVTDASYTKVLLNAEDFDIGGNFDTTNSRFVAPVNGYYQINGYVGFTEVIANKRYASVIYVNGASARFASMSNGSDTGNLYISNSVLAYVAAGQYVELYAWLSVGANTVDVYGGVTTSAASKLDVFLVSPA